MEYHKIDTLFERNPDFRVDATRIKSPVLATIREWDVTEKIDGTNIRVTLNEDGFLRFGGRSDNAQLPTDLIQRLMQMFTAESLQDVFWIDDKPTSVILYGEGYGAGIQKGGCYRSDKGFILFDALVNNKWWMDHAAINDIATKLRVDVVPYLGRMTLEEIVDHVRVPFPSKIGTGMAEGIVARPIEPLFDRKGARVIIKLKTRDFIGGSRLH